MEARTKITLRDEERALIRRLSAKTGYVGIVTFRGPRGRRYRPVRTKACITLDQAIAEVADIRGRQYRNGAFPTSDEVYAVDHLGRVIG